MHPNGETLRISIRVQENLQDLLIAELVDIGFDAFQQEESLLMAFCSGSLWSDETRTLLQDWLASHQQSVSIEVESIPEENWNEIWEASLGPIEAGSVIIKPSWIEPSPEWGQRVVIEIDPKMSFGTGYHPSTRLALILLQDAIRPDDQALDAGSGTGVLAIAAVRMGARFVFAFDNDPWAQRNALENVQRNNVGHAVTVRLGEADCIPDSPFDLVMANINLNVIREMLPVFVSRLMPDGRIVVSGLLKEDEASIRSLAAEFGLTVTRQQLEDDWYAATLAAGA